jgi:hypothetical protein
MRSARSACLAALIAVVLAAGGCGDDGAARDSEPPATQPRVLGGQTSPQGKLTLFCQVSRDLRATLRAKPVDIDRLGDLLGAYLTSAPDEVQPRVESVIGSFVFRAPPPAEDVKAVRAFKAKHCAQARS